MTWVKLDDQLPEHEKITEAGHEAAWLFVCGLCYCGRRLSDGVIPKNVLRRLSDLKRPERAAERLVEVGLWEDEGDWWSVHNYLDYQPSRSQVESQRDSARERQRKSRERRGGSSRAPTPDPYPDPGSGVAGCDDENRANGRRSSSSSFDPDADVFLKAGYIAARSKPAGKIRDLDDYALGCARSIERERGHLLPELRAQGKTDDEIALALVDRNCATDVELGWLDEPMEALP